MFFGCGNAGEILPGGSGVGDPSTMGLADASPFHVDDDNRLSPFHLGRLPHSRVSSRIRRTGRLRCGRRRLLSPRAFALLAGARAFERARLRDRRSHRTGGAELCIRVPARSRPAALCHAAASAAVFLLLLSPHYPWYFAWLIVFACFVRSFALLWLTNACLLLYLMTGYAFIPSTQRLIIETTIYGPFGLLALLDIWAHCRGGSRRLGAAGSGGTGFRNRATSNAAF